MTPSLTVALLLGIATGLVAVVAERFGFPAYVITAVPLFAGLLYISRRLRREKGPHT
ncbi:MAG: hypothetical protein ABW156_11860 [Jiangellaceae bacterium]